MRERKIHSTMYSLAEIDKIVSNGICTLDLKGEPAELYTPIEYMMSIGGKRIRPRLALLACSLFTDKIEPQQVYPALGLEVFHTFTLIHDDIMDRADIRRGQPTVYRKWNENIAILSGDVMSIQAYEYVCKAPADKLQAVLAVFSDTARKVCEGQQYDMNYETMPVVTALYRYGYDLGLAFQITDDYLDTFGDPAVFGKNIGGDIVNNKKTWLYVEAARLASGEQKTRFGEIFRMGEDRAAEKIAAAQQLFTELGVKDNAEKAIEHYFHKAMETVEALSLGAQKLSLLEEFATQITYRRK